MGEPSAGSLPVRDATPAVTVVVPCFNAEKWIVRTLRSVLDEDLPDLRLIVIDDGSTDRSTEVVRSFGDRVQLERTSNLGGCAARNLGLALTETPYVMFLDADDYVDEGLLGHLARGLDRTGADLALARFAAERPDGSREIYDHYPHQASPLEIFRDWFDYKWIPPCGMMWRTQFLRRIGGWRPNMMINQDGELVVRAMLSSPALCSVREGIGVYNLHDDASVSKMRTAAVLASDVEAIGEVVERAMGGPMEAGLIGCQCRAYHLALLAYEAGYNAVGDQALRLAHRAGLKGHLGGRAHRLACAVMGLKWKTRVSVAVRRLRNRPKPTASGAAPVLRGGR